MENFLIVSFVIAMLGVLIALWLRYHTKNVLHKPINTNSIWASNDSHCFID